MNIIVKLFGCAIGIMGLVGLIKPEILQKMMAFWKEGKNIYFAGMIRLAIGASLLIAAPGSLLPLAAAALGIFVMISGIILFVMDIEEIKKQITYWEGQSLLIRRLMAIIIISFGALLFYLV